MDKKEYGYYIFRAWIRNPRTGEKIYAKDYGLKAFPIFIKKIRK